MKLGILFIVISARLICQTISKGIGKVYIGRQNSSLTRLYFPVNNKSTVLPVYVKVWNETEEVLLEDNITINCELSIYRSGFSQVDFSTIKLYPNKTWGLVPISRVIRAGRQVEVHCYGWSTTAGNGNFTFPQNEIQFTNETSISDPIFLIITAAPTVSICSHVIFIHDDYEPSTGYFFVELSEPVAVHKVNVSCRQTIANISEEIMNLEIEPVILKPSENRAVMHYKVLRKGSPQYVQCTAFSINGTQYNVNNSQGEQALFKLDRGEVTLLPEFNVVRTLSFRAYLVLDASLNTSGLKFTCFAKTVNSVPKAEMMVKNPNCSGISNTVVTTTPANFTGMETTASTKTQGNSTQHFPWRVPEQNIRFWSGKIYRSVDVVRQSTSFISGQQEFVVVTCCPHNNLKYAIKSATMLASVFLDSLIPANFSDVSKVESPIDPAYVNIAPCPCDLLAGSCDTNCCCDMDCSDEDKKIFDVCTPGQLSTELLLPVVEHSCYSKHLYKEDTFPFICVQTENRDYLRVYHSTEESVKYLKEFKNRLVEVDPFFSYRKDAVHGDKVNEMQYKHGQTVNTIRQNVSNALLGILALPQRILAGKCLTTAPVQFLMDKESDCVYKMSKDLCSIDTVLSAHIYVLPTSMTSPHCLTPYHVLSDLSTKTVARTDVHYYCATDLSKYVKSLKNLDDMQGKQVNLLNPIIEKSICLDDVRNNSCYGKHEEELPPRCIWDDGYTRPPAPIYDDSTSPHTCNNAVVDVRYKFIWSGTKILLLNATVILGNISMRTIKSRTKNIFYTETVTHEVYNSTANTTMNRIEQVTQIKEDYMEINESAMLTQLYKVTFEHSGLGNTTPIHRPGYVGYNVGKPIFSGLSILNSSTKEFLYVDLNHSSQTGVWYPGPSSLCWYASRYPITFGHDLLSGCSVQLRFETLNDCQNLRNWTLHQLNALMPADKLGRYSYSSPLALDHWIDIFRQDLSSLFENITENMTGIPTENMTVNDTEMFTAGVTTTQIKTPVTSKTMTGNTSEDNSTVMERTEDFLTGLCLDIPVGVHLDIMYAETGQIHGEPINEIIGGYISYTIAPWHFSCDVCNLLSSSVRFIKVPELTPPPAYRFESNSNVCKFDSCWPQLLFPLTDVFEGGSYMYNLGFSLVIVMFGIGYFMITRPWC